jgi:hypothetical protein
MSGLLALGVSAPSLRQGFFLDDHAHTTVVDAILHGRLPASESLRLYEFAAGGPAAVRDLIMRGEVPWWAQDDFRMRFFRPLPSLLRVVDQYLFGALPFGYHAHSALWYAAAVAAAALLFQRVLPGRTALVASMLFAVAPAHAGPVAWIAARHVLVAALPALLGLGAYVRYREDGTRAHGVLAACCLALGLLGSEIGLGAFCYVLSYELFARRREPWRARMRAAWPVLVLPVVYLAAYATAGFGARGGDAYHDPLSSPLQFLRDVVIRTAILLADLLGGVSADQADGRKDGGLAVVGVAMSAVTALLYQRVRQTIPQQEREVLRWLVPGSLGALLVGAGGMLSGRVLMLSGVGSAALVACILRFGWQRAADRGPRFFARRAGYVLLVLVHGLFGLGMLIAYPLALDVLDGRMRALAEASELGAADGADFFVIAPDALAGYAALKLLPRRSGVNRVTLLTEVPHSVRVMRTSDRELRLDVVEGALLETSVERMFRMRSRPLAVGDTVALHGAEIEVRALRNLQPSAFVLRFPHSLDRGRERILFWRSGRFQPLDLLRVGESKEIPWEIGPAH